MRILPAFDHFKEEASLIGKMLAGYSELEIGLMYSVDKIFGDFDTALKIMFRTRGETKRIDIADAFGRNYYRKIGLGTQFEMAIGAIRHCMKIRHQYAHCAWTTAKSPYLGFCKLEEIAVENKEVTSLESLEVYCVDVLVLLDQFNYFGYADEMITWVAHQGQVVNKEIQSNPFSWPGQLKPPPMHIP